MAKSTDHKIYVHYTDEGPKIFALGLQSPKDALTPLHKTLVVIEWLYEGQVPNPDQGLLFSILDKALEPIRKSGPHIMMHSIVGCGMRELCYYTTNYDQFMIELNDCLAHLPSLPIEITHNDDPNWKYATSLRKLAQEGELFEKAA